MVLLTYLLTSGVNHARPDDRWPGRILRMAWPVFRHLGWAGFVGPGRILGKTENCEPTHHHRPDSHGKS